MASEVRAYFTRYPELLDAVSAEDEGHQKRLDKLRRALDKAKPQAKKSKTKTKTKAKTKAKAKKRVPGNPRG